MDNFSSRVFSHSYPLFQIANTAFIHCFIYELSY